MNTKYNNIIDINNQTKGFSNAALLKISNIPFEHTGEDINKSEQNAFTIYQYWDKEENNNSKYSRLSESLKLRILQMFFENKMSYQIISNRLQVSYSSVRRTVIDF